MWPCKPIKARATRAWAYWIIMVSAVASAFVNVAFVPLYELADDVGRGGRVGRESRRWTGHGHGQRPVRGCGTLPRLSESVAMRRSLTRT